MLDPMFIATHDTLWNPAILETRSLPRKFLGRVAIVPRRGASTPFLARLAFEAQPLRYGGALVPFVVAMMIWPHLALPIAQAPLIMLAVLALVEMKLLRHDEASRERLVDDETVARHLATLSFNARSCLREIAARQEIAEGELQLVIEQSELARITPLTLVSVQSATPAPRILALDARERDLLDARLFDGEVRETDLQDVNQRQSTFLREFRIEARSVSAHARLAARLGRSAMAGA
ncbi:hypothetical protein LX81_02850 [Palleronia aestuarii]|uniref:Uncharacterized protein n=1 Tax=Palleronia aestuarii TaxID=568105 RepID=A0A2W7NMR6_9RHOB|nr:hypothetical protein [Palleronia aestuarii]PZX14476.1 hypothetical protein LX81_02850 [Palleronia aestuarii]